MMFVKRLLVTLLSALLISQAALASRLITGGDYLQVSQTVITDEPITIFVWFKRNGSLTSSQTLAMIGELDQVDGNHSWQLFIDSDDTIRGRTESTTGGNTIAPSVGNDTASWHTAVYTSTATNSRWAYLDGVAGTEVTSAVPTVTSANVNSLRIGASTEDGPISTLDCRVAHIAIWARVLTAGEITGLHGGDNPLAVHPSDLRLYYPLVDDDLTDHVGALDLTDVGGTTHDADNPTVDDPPEPPAGIPLLRRRRAANDDQFEQPLRAVGF